MTAYFKQLNKQHGAEGVKNCQQVRWNKPGETKSSFHSLTLEPDIFRIIILAVHTTVSSHVVCFFHETSSAQSSLSSPHQKPVQVFFLSYDTFLPALSSHSFYLKAELWLFLNNLLQTEYIFDAVTSLVLTKQDQVVMLWVLKPSSTQKQQFRSPC